MIGEESLRSVVLTVAVDGSVTVVVDGRAVPAGGGAWVRESFAAILDEVTEDRGVSALVEVRESDGSVFTDRIAAARPRSQVGEGAGWGGPLEGFLPGEQVAVARVTGHFTAGPDGLVQTDPPPVPVRGSGGMLLVGRVSGTLQVVAG